MSDYCMTCGAEEGTAEGQCPAFVGGDHPETEDYSNDWAERAQKAESALAKYETDMRLAAGELRINIDEMPPGSNMARIVSANRLLRNEMNILKRKHQMETSVLLGQRNEALLKLAFVHRFEIHHVMVERLTNGWWKARNGMVEILRDVTQNEAFNAARQLVGDD